MLFISKICKIHKAKSLNNTRFLDFLKKWKYILCYCFLVKRKNHVKQKVYKHLQIFKFWKISKNNLKKEQMFDSNYLSLSLKIITLKFYFVTANYSTAWSKGSWKITCNRKSRYRRVELHTKIRVLVANRKK